MNPSPSFVDCSKPPGVFSAKPAGSKRVLVRNHQGARWARVPIRGTERVARDRPVLGASCPGCGAARADGNSGSGLISVGAMNLSRLAFWCGIAFVVLLVACGDDPKPAR